MRRRINAAVSAISAVSVFVAALSAQAPSKTRATVETLASSRLEGRLAGSNGEKLAGDYLVAELKRIGAKPLPGQADFLEPFEFTAGSRDGGSTINIRGKGATGGPDGKPLVRALSFSDNGDVEAPLVFAGYGIVVPESQGLAYDSYATLDVTDRTATLHADVVREKRTGHNVIAYLPATDVTASTRKPWVALGAHYDHLGHGEAGNTLAAKEDAGKVHFGADDNASGSAAALAVGAALAARPRHRNVLLAFWSGEELGLLGSAAFVAHPPMPI